MLFIEAMCHFPKQRLWDGGPPPFAAFAQWRLSPLCFFSWLATETYVVKNREPEFDWLCLAAHENTESKT